MHSHFKYLLILLASALITSYAVLWLLRPAPLESITIPPVLMKEQQGELVVWGGWRTVEGYQSQDVNAVEVRCNRDRGTCNEAFATILHHEAGEDLEAQVFHYQITRWDSEKL